MVDPLGNIAPPYDNTGANLTSIPPSSSLTPAIGTTTILTLFTRTSEVLSVVHRPNWPATWICQTLYGENGVSEFHAPEGQQLVVSLPLHRDVCEIVVHRWRNLFERENK